MTNTMNVTEDAIRTGEWAWVMMLADELPEEDLSAEIARSDADAHVAIARGDLAEAARRLHATAQLSPLNAPCVLPHAAQAALWSCDRDAAAVAPEARSILEGVSATAADPTSAAEPTSAANPTSAAEPTSAATPARGHHPA